MDEPAGRQQGLCYDEGVLVKLSDAEVIILKRLRGISFGRLIIYIIHGKPVKHCRELWERLDKEEWEEAEHTIPECDSH